VKYFNKVVFVLAMVLIFSTILDLFTAIGILIEFRTPILGVIFDGLVQSVCIILIVILFTIKYFRNKYFLIVTISFPLVVIFLFFAWISIVWPFPLIKNDMVIYKKDTYPVKYLIFQYYETGIGGNANYKVILTSNYKSLIRIYNNLDRKIIPNYLSFESFDPVQKDLVPKSIIIDGTNYTLFKIQNRVY